MIQIATTGFFRVPGVELHRDKVKDNQHDVEDCKASLQTEGIHRLDVVLLHKLLVSGKLAGFESHDKDNEDVAKNRVACAFILTAFAFL